jgi:hypothetical protein
MTGPKFGILTDNTTMLIPFSSNHKVSIWRKLECNMLVDPVFSNGGDQARDTICVPKASLLLRVIELAPPSCCDFKEANGDFKTLFWDQNIYILI